MSAIVAALQRTWWAAPVLLTLALLAWEACLGAAFDVRFDGSGLTMVCLQVLAVALALSASRREVRVGSLALGRVLWWLTLLMVAVSQVISSGGELSAGSYMFLSGFAAFVIGLELARRLPARLKAATERLFARDILVLSPDDRATCDQVLAQRVEKWSRIGARTATVALAVLWLLVLTQLPGNRSLFALWIVAFECLCAWAAGEQLGRMAAHGTMWRIQRAYGARLDVQPGHVDGAGGLKPLGDFYLVQSMLAAIPALYIAAWWWIIPFVEGLDMYRTPYLGLLVLAIATEILAFVVPMAGIHRAMRTRKGELTHDADRLTVQLADLRSQLLEAAADRDALKGRIEHLETEFWLIERAPTWPLTRTLRRRFGLQNLALVLPFIGYAVQVTALWQKFRGQG